jgi:hypothetical protein
MLEVIAAAAPSMPAWTFPPETLPGPVGFFYCANPQSTLGLEEPLGGLCWASFTAQGTPVLPAGTVPVLKGSGVPYSTNVADVSQCQLTLCVHMEGRLVPALTIPISSGETLNTLTQYYEQTERDRLIALGRPDHGGSMLGLRYFAAMVSFLEQRLFATEVRDQLPRAVRRRGRIGRLSPIHVVYLRRFQRQASDTTEAQAVEWSHRWFVRGHWRQHWWPREHVHKPLWISTYLKGPEDKPVKPPGLRVYAVTR